MMKTKVTRKTYLIVNQLPLYRYGQTALIKIESLFKDHSTMLFLDFAKDMKELRQKNIKAGRYRADKWVDKCQ